MNGLVMRQKASFSDERVLCAWLRQALAEERLAFVFGAGVSRGFGLPSWEELLDRMLEISQIDKPKGLSFESLSQYIFREVAHSNKMEFARLVSRALYQDFQFESMHANPLVAELTALVGVGEDKISKILTFNFDDVLDKYLDERNIKVQTIYQPRYPRSGQAGIAINHIHGLLPSRVDEQDLLDGEIVFTRKDFLKRTNVIKNIWRQRAMDLMCGNICIFIGVSGDDDNLMSMLMDVNQQHSNSKHSHYWAVRLASPEDSNKEEFEEEGVFQVTLPHTEIPNFLKRTLRD